ncbi:hypothetical protein GH714_042406 [Hevea brasiliensis]|uniref:non-specific serine/threonine protein kinase n=1 Tax=Hevea brasiliensis TaxID=3981 RepID=A0A6A6NFA4_HEVBR|nr:hypothetical protein GH714_042406 [Hevea brasiliensis]
MSSNTRLIVLFSITRYLHFYADYTQALSFSIDRFDPGANNIIYEGDATPSVGAIEMNLAEWLCRVGRATYAEPLHLWDSSNRTLTDFTTNFSFTIDTLNADKYGHGIAFFLSSLGSSIPTNSPGGFLGLFNTTTSAAASRNQLVAVEFDTFVNEEWDPPVQHVGINNNSIASAVYAKWDPGSYSGKTAKVGISYNATTKNLSVLWTYDENLVFTGNNSLSYLIDLMELLPEWVSFGFSASTGQYVERNTINSWAFSSNLGAKVASHKKGKLKTVWIALIAVAGAGVCFLVLLFLLNKFCTTVPVSRRPWPINFSYGDLADATNNFADDRKLGKGLSGTVFEGFLRDLGCQVAVKKIDAESEDLFINEVNIISSLKHRNLVKFMGWCHEQGKFLLVYEYMSKGSLHDHLFGNRKILRWNNKSSGDSGYVAPEFRRKGRATTHSDMYSFGVVALEIACGKMNYRNNDPQKLIKEVWTLYKAEKILDAADKKLKKEFDPKEMECLMIVGLLCTNPADNGRPSAGRVMQYLNSPELPLPELPPLLHDPEFPVNLDAGERITQ